MKGAFKTERVEAKVVSSPTRRKAHRGHLRGGVARLVVHPRKSVSQGFCKVDQTPVTAEELGFLSVAATDGRPLVCFFSFFGPQINLKTTFDISSEQNCTRAM